MVKVKYENGKWITLEKYSPEGFYLNQKLKTKLDNILMVQKKNWDCVFVIDGVEGSGKSTLGLTCGWYLSHEKMTKNNICIGVDDLLDKFEKFEDGSVIIIDEGSLFFGSRDHMTKEQRKLIKILNVIRQKKIILIIVCPSFFDLNRYISVHRSRFLIHVSTDSKLQRGRFMFFGSRRKNILFEIGKRNFNSYKKPKSDFTGTFTNFQVPFYEEYLEEIKKKTMDGVLEEKKDKEKVNKDKEKLEELRGETIHRYKLHRNLLIIRLLKLKIDTQGSLSKFFEKNDTNLSQGTISEIKREYWGGVKV